jgi:hypothetical protein
LQATDHSTIASTAKRGTRGHAPDAVRRRALQLAEFNLQLAGLLGTFSCHLGDLLHLFTVFGHFGFKSTLEGADPIHDGNHGSIHPATQTSPFLGNTTLEICQLCRMFSSQLSAPLLEQLVDKLLNVLGSDLKLRCPHRR